MSLPTCDFNQKDSFEKCMMISDAFNLHIYPVRTAITAQYLHICSTDEEESKHIIVHETLSQSCSTDEEELKKASSTKLYHRSVP